VAKKICAGNVEIIIGFFLSFVLKGKTELPYDPDIPLQYILK
jgi:hypothetical protein